jgi:hypothetical protein
MIDGKIAFLAGALLLGGCAYNGSSGDYRA